jgi:hypothetical protein
MLTETAFGKQDDDGVCFLDIDDLGILKKRGKVETFEIVKFNRWGWTNKFEFDNVGVYNASLSMYAGAAQCDLCRGSVVGNVDIVYSGGNLTVRYTVFDEFLLNEVHIHVDGPANVNKVPSIDGVYTVAPGQFGCGTHRTDDEDYCIVSPRNTDSVFEARFEDVPETFYVIAHAVVAGSSQAFSDNKGNEC